MNDGSWRKGFAGSVTGAGRVCWVSDGVGGLPGQCWVVAGGVVRGCWVIEGGGVFAASQGWWAVGLAVAKKLGAEHIP